MADVYLATDRDVPSLPHSPMNPIVNDSPIVHPSYLRDGIESVHHAKSPLELVRTPWRHLELLRELVRRDVAGRYRGSSLGIIWSLLHPLAMLAAFTIVFGVFLQARWAGTDNSLQFSVVLFAGLIVFSFFAECVNRAPLLVTMHPNFVKKVVFPLELFPWMVVGTALFHAGISVLVWCVFHAAVFGNIPASILYLPLVFVPLALLALGVSFALSATSVYLRDIAQATPIVVQILMFVSPVFYSVESIPPAFRPLLEINPLTFLIEQARAVMLGRGPVDWTGLCLATAGTLVFAWITYAWFQHLREGFADVL